MLEISKIQTQVSKKPLKYPALFAAKTPKECLKLLNQNNVQLYNWQKKNLNENKNEIYYFETEKGLVSTLIFKEFKSKSDSIPGQFNINAYSFYRDNILTWLKKINFSDFSFIAAEKTPPQAFKGFGVGVALSSYNFKKTQSLKILLPRANKNLDIGLHKGHCINHARCLVDTPPNILDPKRFKDLIVKEFNNVDNFKVKVLNKVQLKKQAYGLILGVGQASKEGPYLVHVSYRKKGAKKTYGGVGKGITFDTGGNDLKPSQFMRWMKKDMGGAAALFGLAKSIKIFKPNMNFDFVFALAENSVSSNAFRPGDVLTAQNGLDVEIHNTDAEGRLVLASGFNYLNTLNVKFNCCFNVATLTGAIKVGLDDRLGGLFSNSEKLGQQVFHASKKSSDPLWLMPLPYWTRSKLNSTVANIVNCTDGYGGAIGAGEFLRFFVPKETPWFHLDIYAWTDSSRDAFFSKGATGQGVQVLQQHFLNI